MIPPFLPVAVLALDLEDTSTENLKQQSAFVPNFCRLIVVPFGFPGRAQDPETFLAKMARRHRCYIVGGFRDKNYHIAIVLNPAGKRLGTYRQTHRLPAEKLTLGNELAPIRTPLGQIGLTLGSDLYFPETQWSLTGQGADYLVHLDTDCEIWDHWHSVLIPRSRAFDCHRPTLVARPSSRKIKLVQNGEFLIPGTPMAGSVIVDVNGAVLASTGFSQGAAVAVLRNHQHSVCPNPPANLRTGRGTDVWKLRFNDSRARYFHPLRTAFTPPAKPRYIRRKIRVAVISHWFKNQIGKDDDVLVDLVRKACARKPDIILCTEMEQECRPDDPRIAATLAKLVRATTRAGSWLVVGGIRANKPGSPQHRSSHAWLWDRRGRLVFESAIMLYGQGCGQDVFDTDFGRIGIRLCGDVYAPELDRLFALGGADIVFNPSMSWGPSGLINSDLGQARALDNGLFIVNAHLVQSDPGLRSQVIDPTGCIVAASPYGENSVLTADIDLDSRKGILVPTKRQRTIQSTEYLANYRNGCGTKLISPQELFPYRRPELYAAIDSEEQIIPPTPRSLVKALKK